ncbi:DUF2182 domain-containing protein [Lentibacter sp. XHP0401]|uniref:DUF2182 domain-containing protein n=1 Tax=Lentibacter sp. XHP0401 TaxID=2984334 RepID=UPI0021E7517D|nr:DUF2182 domain-containing protein [Lentibacter sp. XHP0401]MCV2892209.1 DUF2182 domain-containing protein [Lentibacter sp. XHP0401]
MILSRIKTMTGLHWLALFAMIALAWAALFAMAVPAEMRAFSSLYGAEFWQALCTVTPDTAGFARLFLMWALMSAAMMAPTALPAFGTYDDLVRSTGRGHFTLLVTGYLLVWLGFAVLAAAVQMALTLVGAVDLLGQSQSPVLTAGLLIGAGLYQFSALKDACLSKCRRPISFFMQHWEEGPWRNGVRLGLVCLGCCWALMLLGFVGGVMNLAFMGLATLMMILEKLPEIGQRLTWPLGFGLIAWGLFALTYVFI